MAEFWPCSADGLQVAGNPNSSMFDINLVTGASTNLGLIQPHGPYNAIGFSVLDNTLWGAALNVPSGIARINTDLTTFITTIPNLPNPAGGWVVGDVDLNGHLYLFRPNFNNRFYVVDVNSASPTYLQLVDPTTGFTLDTAPFGTPIPADPVIFDWAFNPIDNQLYGVVDTGPSGQVRQINPITGAVTNIPTVGLPGGSFYGAVFFDAQGILYAINNNTGNVYRITLSGGTASAILFSTSAASNNNDGARCPLALINLLTVTKSVDQAIASPGSTLTYTMIITNESSVLTADNVIFTDPIPIGTTFVPGSVTVNAVPTAGDPSVGIPLGNIAPSTSVTVTFQVLIGAAPPSDILNTATITADNSAPATSNQVVTTVNQASLVSIKTVSDAFADIGDVLTYNIALVNTGNISADNTLFTDPIPNGFTFIPNSVTVNGAPLPGADPAIGFTVGSIPPGGFSTVSFQVTVTSIPVPNPAVNIATTTFQYTVNPNLPPVPGTSTSNPATTQVNNAALTSVKTVNHAFANIGDVLTYTVTLTNTGNVPADNTLFTDPIPNGTTFVPNSVTVDGAPLPGADPAVGFTVGSVPPGASVTVSFQVTVTSIPVPNPAVNIATTTFQYTVNPNLPPVSGTSTSNPATTQVNNAALTSVKTVNHAFANIGDVLTYTVTLTNTGNVPADNTLFTDPIPNGTTFVPNSVTVNGAPLPGADPAVGFTVGSIPPGASVTVSFQVTVTSIPVPNPAVNIATTTFQYTVNPNLPPVPGTSTSNPATTQVNNAALTSVKTVNHAFANIGDVLTYTVTLTNTGNVPADNTLFTDPIPNGTTFVPNSVTVNGAPLPGADPAVGFTVGSIPPGASVTVSFQVTVTSIPVPNPAVNIATTTFQYTVNPNLPPVPGTSTSNPATTQVNNAILEIIKTVDKNTANIGDILTYTLTLTNTGNIPALNVQVTDPVPSGTTYIANSVTIDGIPQPGADPNNIIFIASINPGESVVIQFKVVIDSILANGVVDNTASVRFSFLPDPSLPPVFVTTTSNTVTTVVPPRVAINLCPITCHFDKHCSNFFKRHSNFYFNQYKWWN
ncbi:hypothetical protein QCI42_21660 [Bacillus fungorum]|uniref:DUF7507 domain-containing protein n=1 Tax=Bacillus fungorum TaxID=2039284 RepID=UPI003391523A